MYLSRSLICVAVIAAFAAPAFADDHLSAKTRNQTNRLIERSLTSSIGYDITESLTTEVGPRPAGSDADARALAWGVAKLKQLGFKNVRIEPFEVTYWERRFEKAEIISPFPQNLTITALGGSVATPTDGVTGEIVRFETLADLKEAPLTGLEGKIVFVDEYMTRTQDGSGYGVAVRKRSGAPYEAGRRGAIAALIRSVGTDSHRVPHTGQMGYKDDVLKVPVAALAAPDADQLQRALKRGPVTVRMILDIVTHEGRPSGNVVGDIPGRSDEIVVIGGHLDSWDLGTGAIDDAAGIGITVGAAKMILDMKKKPNRTIRVVMWGAEESSGSGARAYAELHADEIDKHIIAAESDFGAGRIWKLDTNFGEDKLAMAAEMHRLLLPLGIALGTNDASGGADVGPLRKLGVPVVTLRQNGWDYFDLHHSADDTLDKIDPDDMAQNVAAYAAFTWMAANIDGDFRGTKQATGE